MLKYRIPLLAVAVLALPGTASAALKSDEVTVQQLIDVVAYLQAAYTKHLPDDYRPYLPLGLVTHE